MLTTFSARNEKGFTLIEVLIVVAIIGVLAGIAVAQFVSLRTRSYNTMAESDLRNAASAQEAYFANHEIYSSTPGDLIGFNSSQGVQFGIPDASNNAYTMTAHHTVGNTTYTLIGPGGSMTKD
jgi:prepilin-type N-terminal cleavage/methylation domain-containing protein